MHHRPGRPSSLVPGQHWARSSKPGRIVIGFPDPRAVLFLDLAIGCERTVSRDGFTQWVRDHQAVQVVDDLPMFREVSRARA